MPNPNPQSSKTQLLTDWLALLEQRHPTEIDLGLERIAQVAERLCLKKPAPTVITVAGTNGKGTCVAVLERLLLDANYHVGSYTSPHFNRYNERICINGIETSDASLCHAFEKIEEARGDISLTYFEFGTLAAFLIMAEASVDVAVLEVGLGGRLDAVNLIDADIAIVTSIALDHQEWLGDDLDTIAAEKAAIARKGKTLIYGDGDPLKGIVQTAKRIGANLICAEKDFNFVLPTHNLATSSVLCALQALKIFDKNIVSNLDFTRLQDIHLPGRFQHKTYQGVHVFLDVAHNPAAAQLLAERLLSNPLLLASQSEKSSTKPVEDSPRTNIRAVCGVMSDKDIEGIVAPLKNIVDEWYPVLIPSQPRAADTLQWQRVLYNTTVYDSVENGFKKALAMSSPTDVVLVFGSFFTVAPIMKQLNRQTNKQNS